MQPVSLREHVGQHRLDGIFGAADVNGEKAVPGLIVHVLEQALAGNAGVVHQQRHGAQLPLHGAYHGLHGAPAGHVCLHGDGVLAPAAQLLRQVLGLLAVLTIVDAHGIALSGQFPGDGPANPPRGSGDQCDRSHKQCSFPVSASHNKTVRIYIQKSTCLSRCFCWWTIQDSNL